VGRLRQIGRNAALDRVVHRVTSGQWWLGVLEEESVMAEAWGMEHEIGVSGSGSRGRKGPILTRLLQSKT